MIAQAILLECPFEPPPHTMPEVIQLVQAQRSLRLMRDAMDRAATCLSDVRQASGSLSNPHDEFVAIVVDQAINAIENLELAIEHMAVVEDRITRHLDDMD